MRDLLDMACTSDAIPIAQHRAGELVAVSDSPTSARSHAGADRTPRPAINAATRNIVRSESLAQARLPASQSQRTSTYLVFSRVSSRTWYVFSARTCLPCVLTDLPNHRVMSRVWATRARTSEGPGGLLRSGGVAQFPGLETGTSSHLACAASPAPACPLSSGVDEQRRQQEPLLPARFLRGSHARVLASRRGEKESSWQRDATGQAARRRLEPAGSRRPQEARRSGG